MGAIWDTITGVEAASGRRLQFPEGQRGIRPLRLLEEDGKRKNESFGRLFRICRWGESNFVHHYISFHHSWRGLRPTSPCGARNALPRLAGLPANHQSRIALVIGRNFFVGQSPATGASCSTEALALGRQDVSLVSLLISYHHSASFFLFNHRQRVEAVCRLSFSQLTRLNQHLGSALADGGHS